MDDVAVVSPRPHGPRSMARTAALYLGLVGLPALGVAGIVHIGGAITPPVSVGGRWAFTTDATTAALPSVTGAPDGKPPVLAIVQSGVRLAMSFEDGGGATSTATLDGDRVRASLATADEKHVALEAVVTKDSGTPRLHGELRRLDCSTCPPVRFDAERVAGPRG